MIQWLNDERPKYKTAQSVYVIEFYAKYDIRVTPCSISSAECHLIYDNKIYFTGRYRMSCWLYDEETYALKTKKIENHIFPTKEAAEQMAKFTNINISIMDWYKAIGSNSDMDPNYWTSVMESELPSGHKGVSEIREVFHKVKRNSGIIEFDRLNLEKSLKWLVDLSPLLKEKWTKENSSMGKIIKQLNIIL